MYCQHVIYSTPFFSLHIQPFALNAPRRPEYPFRSEEDERAEVTEPGKYGAIARPTSEELQRVWYESDDRSLFAECDAYPPCDEEDDEEGVEWSAKFDGRTEPSVAEKFFESRLVDSLMQERQDSVSTSGSFGAFGSSLAFHAEAGRSSLGLSHYEHHYEEEFRCRNEDQNAAFYWSDAEAEHFVDALTR